MSQSGEKTEKATSKKRKDERERGNILKSHDISTALILIASIFTLKLLGDYIGKSMTEIFSESLSSAGNITSKALTIPLAQNTLTQAVISGMKILLPFFGVVVIATIAIQLTQTRFLFTTKTLSVKFERISPLSGFKRMFSIKSVAEMVKSVMKIVIILLAVIQEVIKDINEVPFMLNLPLVKVTPILFANVLSVAIKCVVILILIAALDIFYQWWSFEKEMKMTKQEVKEETKLSEGNPQTKSRIQQKQRQMSAMRMMADVPKADVVITNPTHFAIALRYRSKKDKAPVILAKGQDYLAQRIKEIARENHIVMIENRPLARSLYENGKIGKAIPTNLFQAVAEVLAYVAKMKKSR